MSAGVIATPTYQGVSKLPTGAHLRTNVLNGNVRVASQTNGVGKQPAFYEIAGGSITNNVKLTLPAVTSSDTLVAQNSNVVWGGAHTFTQGLNASGPFVSTSSITGQSVSANSASVTSTVRAGGDISTSSNLNTTHNLVVGVNASVAGDHSVNGAIVGNGSMFLKANTYGTDTSYFTVTLGNAFGTIFGVLGAGKIAFHGATPAGQGTGGSLTANLPYDANTQGMINQMWGWMRNNGFLS